MGLFKGAGQNALSGAAAGSAGGWIGSAIGAGVGLIGTMLSNRANRRANEKLADKQFEQNKEMWSLQNQYNTPSAQVSRLKAAGLNPALAYGGSGSVVGTADSTPQLDYSGAMGASVAPDVNSSIQQGMNAFQMLLQRDANRSNINLQDSQADLNRVTAAIKAEQNPYEIKNIQAQTLLHQAQTDSTYVGIQQIQGQIAKLATDTYGAKLANELLERSMDARVQAYTLENTKTIAETRELNARMSKYSAEIAQLKASAQELIERTTQYSHQNALTDSQKAELDQLAKNYEAQYNGLVASSKIAEKDVRWYVADKIGSILAGTVKGASSAAGAAGLLLKAL